MEDPEARVEVLLPGNATAADCARRATRATLLRWDMAYRVDDVVLVVSELVGNCVRHAKPPYFLGLVRGDNGLRVEVQDGSPGLPRIVPVEDYSESGRGMHIVRELADEVQVRETQGHGKVVSASFSTNGGRSRPRRDSMISD